MRNDIKKAAQGQLFLLYIVEGFPANIIFDLT